MKLDSSHVDEHASSHMHGFDESQIDPQLQMESIGVYNLQSSSAVNEDISISSTTSLVSSGITENHGPKVYTQPRMFLY